MEFKKTELVFSDVFTAFNVEVMDGNFTLSLVELEEDIVRSTENHTIVKERSTTEVYLGKEEIEQIINALQYIIKE